MITLVPYRSDCEHITLSLIHGFWLAHNRYQQSDEEAKGDLDAWTGSGHQLYLISLDGESVGFLHLGSRGGKCDWLEDIFVKPEYQNRGIGTKAVELAEEIVRQYSLSLYIEAAARNRRAIALYHRLGYDCLNTITVRKDFPEYQYDVRRRESIWDKPFEIRADKE